MENNIESNRVLVQENFLNKDFLPKTSETKIILKKIKDDWFSITRELKIFELWTEEYVNNLGNYLYNRILELEKEYKKEIVILEIWAGNWRLSYFLNKHLLKKNIKYKVLAIDDFSWELNVDFNNVENISCEKAIEKYKPDIILFSWMPYNADYTKDFRNYKAIKEYILIGESHWWCCWSDDTWDEQLVKPFKMKELGLWEQICRTDYYPNFISHSSTFSFQNKKELT